MTHAIRPVDFDNLKTMTYEVTERVARITFNRPEKGNAIIADTPLELSALVERADLDPAVHVILVSGRGEGFCAGFDLSAYADRSGSADDIAEAVTWLASPASDYIHGHVLTVSGGQIGGMTA